MAVQNTIKVAARRREATLGFWEQAYIFEALRGLGITTKHFVSNLYYHILKLFGIIKTHPLTPTIQYPEEHRPLAPRLRTLHRLARREDGAPRCVACMMCETVCPALCIQIVADDTGNPQIEKRPKNFDIDLGKCIYCGFCVEACPEDAIRMDTGILEISAYSREGMVLDIDLLLALRPTHLRTDKEVDELQRRLLK
ncbi:NuoI/complex I 23 kDa subunit family protein [Candidatus Zixiibacteriota bacterium]